MNEQVRAFNKLKAITLGTGIAAAAFWLSLFAGASKTTIGILILSVGVILSMLAVAGFSREEDHLEVGIRAAIAALAVGALLFLLAGVTGSLTMALLVPVAMLAVGGAIALPGDADPQQASMRIIVSGIGAAAVVFSGFIAEELWALFAPLVPLPGLLLADRLAERSKE